jgi:CRISPR-associated endonuclease/helicase Cas3
MTFDAYYRDRRGRDPFPWMSRLAERFAALELPEVIDLPTGSGKSDLVVVWAWARRVNPRLPRRLWMVSDRRVIVDQSFEAAQALQQSDGIHVSRLRGGIVSEDDDLLDPVMPQIITSTVDQLGSRLLFRAYGSSPRTWPIWAGLAGNDSLIVLDEAHLSPVAEDTLQACRRLGAGISVISMTATPRLSDADRFGLAAEDRNHPELGRRLKAKRIVELRDNGSLVEAAHELLADDCRKVAVICNTVREARRTFARLHHQHKYLIIGRQRPLDRDRILMELLPNVKSGAPDGEPLVVVATQCIEAGADFDFDGMVSEACPIDALRQRLGRLDRLGRRGESRCILIRPENIKDVPPYGAAPDAAWRWLQKHATKKAINLGAEGWDAISEPVPEEARSARPQPVSFLEPHLRMLARTSPRPRVEPDIDLLLHGPKRAPGAVFLVWRHDIKTSPDAVAAANEILAILPPDGLEACEVPLWEVRAWLTGQSLSADGGDVEGALLAAPRPDPQAASRKVFPWDGAEGGVVLTEPGALRPGDVVVLPAAFGGYDRFGWNPNSAEPVADVADEAYHRRTGRRIERVADVDADVVGDRIHPWSGGVVVETFTDERRSRAAVVEVTLATHSQAVAKRSRDHAQALGLDEEILYSATLHHDAGKADPGWQLCVNGGSLKRLAEPPLAKGAFVRSPLSRLPSGWRHEAESLKRLSADARDLVRWLIATHHGHARPFWPIPEHGAGLAELMDELQAEHGYWRLALYETVLRCADRAVSKEEMHGWVEP